MLWNVELDNKIILNLLLFHDKGMDLTTGMDLKRNFELEPSFLLCYFHLIS